MDGKYINAAPADVRENRDDVKINTGFASNTHSHNLLSTFFNIPCQSPQMNDRCEHHQFAGNVSRKRPRPNIAVSMITTTFILMSRNVVGGVYLPTWSSLTLGETQYLSSKYKNATVSSEPLNIQPSNTIDDNQQHNVVRRSRRDDNYGKGEFTTGKEPSKGLPANERDTINADISGYTTSQSKNQRRPTYERSRMSTTKVLGDDRLQLNSFVPPEQAIYDQRDHDRFLSWCKDTLGIFSLLEIKIFDYEDFMSVDLVVDLEDDLLDAPNDNTGLKEKHRVPIRGLAAIQDIEKGEVILEIPLKVLWSIGTTIDKDPVLGGNVMGPDARANFGWNISVTHDNKPQSDIIESNSTEAQFFEIPLLAVALLYHLQLKEGSPYAPHINILKATPIDSMPFLWTAKRLKESPVATEGVRTVAKGIRQEMRDMYESVVQVLIDQHPSIFGKDTARRNNHEWMYSYDKFQWAFAIINSRHWQLPIEDVDVASSISVDTKADDTIQARTFKADEVGAPGSVTVDEQLPPASTPTQHWVQEHGDIDVEQTGPLTSENSLNYGSSIGNSFLLAPIADLLNFGPPCTRVRYNYQTHKFEIIASCDFRKGDEVTFWYSDECRHVMAGIYGFSHPLIAECPSVEDLRLQTESLEEKLSEAYTEMDRIEKEFDHIETVLSGCECCLYDKQSSAESRKRPMTIRRHHPTKVRSYRSSKSMKRDGKPGDRVLHSRRSEF